MSYRCQREKHCSPVTLILATFQVSAGLQLRGGRDEERKMLIPKLLALLPAIVPYVFGVLNGPATS